jgi:hypothetical protein
MPFDQVFSFPIRASATYIDSILTIVQDVRACEGMRVKLDLSSTRDVSTFLICMLCGLIDTAYYRNTRISLILPRNKASAKALRAVKVISHSKGRPEIQISEHIGQLRKITSNNPQAIHDIVDLLGFQRNISDELSFAMKLVLTEILTNAIDHSGERAFYICGTTRPFSNSINFTGVDFGVGIPGKLRTRHTKIANDHDLLRLLLKEGLSTRTVMEGGKGFRNIQGVLAANKGRISIISGSAKAFLRFDRGEYIIKPSRRAFVGTCIDLQFAIHDAIDSPNSTIAETVEEFL